MCQPSWCRWRWKKGPKQRWSGYFSLCPFPSWKGVFSQNGPQRSRARRCCAAKRTLHGEDRSEILDKRERGGPKWTAKMAQSLTASDIMDEKSVESRSQQTGSFLVAAAGQDAVDRRVAGDRDPQPPGVSSHFPARFVHGDAGTRPDLADEILVGRFALFSQARQSLAQPAGCQGQAKSLEKALSRTAVVLPRGIPSSLFRMVAGARASGPTSAAAAPRASEVWRESRPWILLPHFAQLPTWI